MRSHPIYLWIGLIVMLVVQLSCNLSVSTSPGASQGNPTETAPPATPQPSLSEATPIPSTPPQPTDTSAPDASPTSPEPTATSGPQCIVQQSLNLRSGPGTAYLPPIGALEEQAQLVPLGYNPVGVPGGPWAQVKDEANNKIGWVSAGEQYISCNIDLTSLPEVAVDPPPPPSPPKTKNSTPDGVFPENLVFKVDFNSKFFVRMDAHDSNVGEDNGDGISEVTFTVKDSDRNVVYEHSEQTAGYCIFGGGEPDCNPWVLEDNVYKWEAGGEPVQDGDYELAVRVVLEDPDSDEGNWRYQISLKLK